jgi:uncharacterized iron-regulated protein
MDLRALAVAVGLGTWSAPAAFPPHQVSFSATEPARLVVVESPSGNLISWPVLAHRMRKVRVIAVGEKHDEGAHHAVQARVLAALSSRTPDLVVGLEMVSIDQQGVLDGFLAGKTSEADFATWWDKNWGFDYSIYKPIFDEARARHVPVYGLNAPLDIVKAVAKNGLAALPPGQRAQLPATVAESSDPRYRVFVAQSLAGHKLPPDALAHMIEAQAVWNETMGAKVAELAATHHVLVIAGQGHVLWRAGVAESAARRGAGAAFVALPSPPDGGSEGIPEQLSRLRDPKSGELAKADAYVLIP